MAESYYTLRYLNSDKFHHSGERVASKDTLHIGNHSDCEVRIENPSKYEDELLAVISPKKDGEGWILVKMTMNSDVAVNGQEVTVAHDLKDGDHISLGDDGQEMVFNIVQDKMPSESKVILMPRGIPKLVIWTCIAVALVCVAAVIFVVRNSSERERLYAEALEKAEKSVFQLSVDSVYWCHIIDNQLYIDSCFSYAYDNGAAVSGTAYLTSDSLLVTARHCIHPWLNDNTIDSIWNPAQIQSTPLRWALLSETYNQIGESDTTRVVISQCTIFGGDRGTQELAQFLSSDFTTDYDNDEIIELGDFDNEYYWRSLKRRRSRSDMMLGDFAYIKYPQAGDIRIASQSDMNKLLKQNTRLDFIGYPSYQERGRETQTDHLRLPYDSTEMLVHNGSLQHGYSGGPVLVLNQGIPYAVGIISVLDINGNGRAYSVPITRVSATNERESH